MLKDGQLPFSKIAKDLDTGTDTVIRRYNALKKEGIIQRASVIIDLKKCGFEGTILFLVKLCAETDAKKFFDKITNIANVIVVSQTVGDYDLLVQAIFTDIENFDTITDKIQSFSEIEYFDVCIGRMIIHGFPSYAYYSQAFDTAATSKGQQGCSTEITSVCNKTKKKDVSTT